MSSAYPAASGAVSAPAAAAAQTGASAQPDYTTANADYMARSRRFPVRVPLVGGNLNAPYAVGTTLNFMAPPVNNGWCNAIELDLNLTLTIGTAAATPNKGYPWNLIDHITINLDGQISYVEPYFACYILPRLKGRLRAGVDSVLAGLQNADLQTTLYVAPATWAVGAVAIRVRYFIPLNALHNLDGSGLLPTQGTQDPLGINVICPSQLLGPDPWNHPATSGAGTTAVVASGTVTCYMWITDGRTLWSPEEQLPFYPNGLPQVSYDREPDVVNLQAGSTVRGQLTKVLKVYYGVSFLIDGQSGANFALNTNINSWDVSADSTGNFKLFQFGLENIQMDLIFERIRRLYGQDFPEGCIPWVVAPHSNIPSPDAANSTDILNMTAGGWTSLFQGVNFIAQGAVAGILPRIHTCILGINDSPYIG